MRRMQIEMAEGSDMHDFVRVLIFCLARLRYVAIDHALVLHS